MTIETRATVRPIAAGDEAALVRFHERLDQQSQYLRFFTAHPHLSPEEAHRFTNVDHEGREALVVVEGDELVAVGRFERQDDDPTIAEIAFVVAADHRQHGVATDLLHRLAGLGRDRGVDTFTASTLGVNHRMREVFVHSGYPCRSTFDEGVYETTLDIREPPLPPPAPA